MPPEENDRASLVHCSYCGVQISEQRLENHKLLRCPKAPPEIKGNRPPKQPKKQSKKSQAPARSKADSTRVFDSHAGLIGNFLEIESWDDKCRFLGFLDLAERKEIFRRLADPDFHLASAHSPSHVNVALDTLDLAVFRRLAQEPSLLYSVSPRRFEEIVAEILADQGCEVQLTPQTRDGGRDILAVFPTPFGQLLTIVECKRYSPDRPVGIDAVERFLWVVTQKDRASFGLMATTSYFSKGAEALARSYQYQLDLRDFEGVTDWIGQYGNWTTTDESGLWVPKSNA